MTWADGNGRTARLLSGYILDINGYGFNGIGSFEEYIAGSFSFLKEREKELLIFLIKKYQQEFTQIEVSKEMSVTNKTIINRLSVLVKNGFVVPILVNERIRSYELSEFSNSHEEEIVKLIRGKNGERLLFCKWKKLV